VSKRIIENGKAVAMVLGLDLSKVSRDGFTLTPFGDDWLVEWSGVAVLDRKAAAILFEGGES
jgi:hypothetical protein